MRRYRLWAALAAQALLLALYYAKSGVWLTLSEWLASFRWEPAGGPFALGPFSAVWLMAACALAEFAAWMCLAGMVGEAILRRISWRAASRPERLIVAAGLGLGLFSLVFFILGIAGLYTPAATLATGLALLAGCGLELRLPPDARRPPIRLSELRPAARRWARQAARLRADPLLLVGALCAAMLALHLLGALLPPTSFDELNYQLALPKLYILNRGFVATPFNHLSFLPRNMSMLFVLGLLSGGPAVAKLFSWAMGVLAAAALFAFVRPKLGSRGAALAAAVFFMTPVVGNQFRLAASDLGAGFYELVGLFLFLRWREDRASKTLALSAAFWGLALGCKYTALPGFLACLLLLAWTFARAWTLDEPGLWKLAAFPAAAAALCSPWLVKNWLDAGNPVDPIFSAALTSRNFFFAGKYKPLVDYAAGLGIPDYFPLRGLHGFLRLPWRLFTLHNDYNHDLGPLLLLCAPLAAFGAPALYRRLRRPSSRWLRDVLCLCALYWAFWLGSNIHMTRYLTAGLGLTSIGAGWLLASLPVRGRWRWALLAPALFAWAQQGLRMAYIQNIHKKPWGYLAGRCSLRDYLNDVLIDSPYNVYAFANENLPPDATVLVSNEFRTFYLDRNFLASTPWDHDYWHELVVLSSDAEDLRRRLRNRGIGYMIANDALRRGLAGPILEPWTKAESLKARALMDGAIDRIYRDPAGAWLAKVR